MATNTTATTQNHNGTGSQNNFAISFAFLANTEVDVKVGGVLKTLGTHYNIVGSQVQFTSGNTPPSGTANIVFTRDTDISAKKVDFADGSVLTETDLDNNSDQILFAQQEFTNDFVKRDGSQTITGNLVFEGATDDGNETTLAITDPTADRTITVPDITGTIVTTGDTGTVSNTMLANSSVSENKLATNSVSEHKIVNGNITEGKLASNSVVASKINNGAVINSKIGNDAVTNSKIADNSIDSEHYVDGSIDTEHYAAGSVNETALGSDSVTNSKIADNSIDSEHYVDGSIDTEHYAAGSINATALASNSVTEHKIANTNVTEGKLAPNSVVTSKINDNAVTIDKIADAAIVTNSEQASHSANDNTFFTTSASDARYFNISSGDTIKDGQTFPDNDTTIATTAAINDRIIDLIDDVGGFTIIASEQAFPNVNPQGVTGQAAVLSIKTATTNLVPSGTTVTVVNGNVANNANITITGVPSTIPSGFGFLVESTSTLHTYTFHRLVPKATEVTTVAGKAVEIGRLGTADAVADMAILGTTDVVADMNTLATADIISDMNTLAVADVISDMNTLAVADVISDMDTVATNVTNVNNVGNNITNINSVSNSAGANQTFTVTVQNVSGNKYFIDGVQTPVLKLARGKTYTFNLADSSNSGHPLAFRDSSDNSYTTGVTTSGTAGSSGATVVIVVAANAPNTLKYYCTSHGNSMGNTINVIDDNVGIVATNIANVNTVGGAITNVNNVGNSISNVNTVATNISSVNSFFNTYRIGANNPTTSLDTGDLFFNTTSNSLKVYTGSAWVDGVTATGSFAVVTGNTFTGSNNHNDNVKSIYGSGNDLEIYHDATDNIIQALGTPKLRLRHSADDGSNVKNAIVTIADGAVELYHNNSKKLETASTGVDVTGDINLTNTQPAINFIDSDNNPDYKVRNSNGGFIVTDTTNSVNRIVINTDGHIDIANNVDFAAGIDVTGNITVTGTVDGVDIAALNTTVSNLTTDLVSDTSPQLGGDLQSNGNDINFADNDKIILGTGNDTFIRHVAGSHTEIDHVGSGDLILETVNGGDDILLNSNDDVFIQHAGESMIVCRSDAQVELYHDNTKRLETTAGGVLVTGSLGTTDTLTVGGGGHIKTGTDTGKFFSGVSNDLKLYHDGTNSYLENDTGDLIIKAAFPTFQGANGETILNAGQNGAVNLYYDNSKKFETTTAGIEVTGNAKFPDNGTLQLGAGQDLQIYHNGTDSYIDDVGTGNLKLRTNGDTVQIHQTNGEKMGRFNSNGSVQLYFDNTEKFSTTSSGTNFNTGTAVFNGPSGTSYTAEIKPINSNPYGLACIENSGANAGYPLFTVTSNGGATYFRTLSGGNSEARAILPVTNNTYDLGSTSKRWANIYTNDLNLSNEGSSNDVDGTWGSYTIQEGVEDLYLINKRTNKKYKFNLTEVS